MSVCHVEMETTHDQMVVSIYIEREVEEVVSVAVFRYMCVCHQSSSAFGAQPDAVTHPTAATLSFNRSQV